MRIENLKWNLYLFYKQDQSANMLMFYFEPSLHLYEVFPQTSDR